MKASAIPKPKQVRSQKTVESILDAAAMLIVGKGFEGLNTNAIAEGAGTNIATLYNYFPNKYAILEALLERFSESLFVMVQVEVQASPDKTLRTEYILEKALNMMQKAPWVPAVFEAFKSSPALREMYEAYCHRMAEQLIVFFPSGGGKPKLNHQQITCIMRLLIEVITSGLNLIVMSPKLQRKTMFKELCCLVNSYLDNYRKL